MKMFVVGLVSFVLGLFVTCLGIEWLPFHDPAARVEVIAQRSILGGDLGAIQAAIPVLRERGLALEKYCIRVDEQDGLWTVLFDDPRSTHDSFGSPDDLMLLAVRIRKSDLSVESWAYQK